MKKNNKNKEKNTLNLDRALNLMMMMKFDSIEFQNGKNNNNNNNNVNNESILYESNNNRPQNIIVHVI